MICLSVWISLLKSPQRYLHRSASLNKSPQVCSEMPPQVWESAGAWENLNNEDTSYTKLVNLRCHLNKSLLHFIVSVERNNSRKKVLVTAQGIHHVSTHEGRNQPHKQSQLDLSARVRPQEGMTKHADWSKQVQISWSKLIVSFENTSFKLIVLMQTSRLK